MAKIAVRENLNLDFLEKALKNYYQSDNVKILSHEITMATKGGDSYTSDIYRVKIDYQLGSDEPITKYFIAKYILDNEMVIRAVADFCVFFPKETEMYTKILPKMSSILNEPLSPKLIYCSKTPSEILLLEDLKTAGLRVMERRDGLDLEHCKIVMKKLGKFHAASMILVEREPGILNKNFNHGFFHNRSKASPEHNIFDFFSGGLKYLIPIVSQWEGFENIARKMKKIEDNFFDAVYTCIDSPKTKVKCINHGDLWTNNFMYEHDVDGKPVDIRFIDFQVVYYSSIGIDLNYFLYTSPTTEVFENNMDELVETYSSFLIETLKKHDYPENKLPTFSDIQNDIRLYAFYGFVSAITILPLVLMERVEGLPSNLESMNDKYWKEIVKKTQLTGESFLKTIKPILLEFERKGVLDVV